MPSAAQDLQKHNRENCTRCGRALSESRVCLRCSEPYRWHPYQLPQRAKHRGFFFEEEDDMYENQLSVIHARLAARKLYSAV